MRPVYLFQKALFILLFFLSTAATVKGQDIFLQKLSILYEILDKHYVDEINEIEFVETAIKSIHSSLDPQSSYLSYEEAAELIKTCEGNALQKISCYYEDVKKQNVEDLKEDDFTEIVFNEILSGLDPHSTYYSVEKADDLKKTIMKVMVYN